MKEYMSIVFIQNEEAEEPLNILEAQGKGAALQYLRQWDYGEDDGETYPENPAGSGDSTYREGNYIMSYNSSMGYIGLCKIITSACTGVSR
ncbi:MAG: hypothetical protein BWY31_03441 [Lentisphaerae bacterium ADurb.Bin242]|nr:MAG: hypothetical protein BWY31_03441 [Lentisphaerae bacterium ADurb.Bin242]